MTYLPSSVCCGASAAAGAERTPLNPLHRSTGRGPCSGGDQGAVLSGRPTHTAVHCQPRLMSTLGEAETKLLIIMWQ